jgi:chloramphenicol 3-O phosphotransferase
VTGLTVVLNGPSSAGKSSIGRALQARWARPLQLSGIDTFLGCQSAAFFGDPQRSCGGFDWLPSPDAAGPVTAIRVGPLGDALLGAAHAYWRACAGGGLDQVVDDVWLSQAAADALTAALAGLPVLWVGVRCDPGELAERERGRGDRTPGQARWQAGRVHRWRGYDLELDTGRATAERCADRVLDALGDRGWLPAGGPAGPGADADRMGG